MDTYMDTYVYIYHILGVDSFSILFKHPSFQKPDLFPLGFDGFLKRRIPGKNGEGTPRHIWIHMVWIPEGLPC